VTPTARVVLRWSVVGAAALLLSMLALLFALSFVSGARLKAPLERLASERLGRAVHIAGDLEVHWSLSPELTLHEVTLGNPPWEPQRPMAKIERLYLKLRLLPLLRGALVLTRVEALHPDIDLHRDRTGRANWTFANEAPSNERAAAPPRLPPIQDLLIEAGTLHITDEIRRLKLSGTIAAHERASDQDPHALGISGQGTLNAEPFALQLAGGPLVNLDPHRPYPFELSVSAGATRLESEGRLRRPFDLGEFELQVRAAGSDLAELYYLTQLALPNTPPYRLQLRIERHGARVHLGDIKGNLGSSDVAGKLDLDLSRRRARLSGELTSERLAMSDLATSVGRRRPAGAPQPAPPPAKAGDKPPKDAQDRLFPDARLQVNRVQGMDADVHYRAAAVQAGASPMKQLALDIKLEEGILTLEPFAFELQQGRLAGTARIDARQARPQVHIDVRMKDIQLDQFKARSPGAIAPFAGVMQARAVIDGTGDSLHRVMASANGTFSAILPHGEVRSEVAELAGVNVLNGLGLLLKGPNDHEPIRCGIMQFHIVDGIGEAQSLVFDAKDVRITGSGQVRLGPEELALQVRGQPKKLRLGHVRAPIQIGGHLTDPKVGVNLFATAKQGAVAAAIAAVAAPAAAILAFVDPGLAKDEDCGALLGSAEAGPAAPLKGKQPPAPAPSPPPGQPLR